MSMTGVEVAQLAVSCPYCGETLEIVEDRSYVWFGCSRCLRYVRREKRELARRYVNYPARFFNWRGLIEELYTLYARLFS